MAKNNRGRNLKKQFPNGGRGTCPICKTTSIKVLWEWKDKEGKDIKVCKRCRHRDPEKVEI